MEIVTYKFVHYEKMLIEGVIQYYKWQICQTSLYVS